MSTVQVKWIKIKKLPSSLGNTVYFNGVDTSTNLDVNGYFVLSGNEAWVPTLVTAIAGTNADIAFDQTSGAVNHQYDESFNFAGTTEVSQLQSPNAHTKVSGVESSSSS